MSELESFMRKQTHEEEANMADIDPRVDKNHILMPDDSIYRIQRDRYQKVRGVPSMLSISCASCNEHLLVYQKDGPGPLKRCYLDRIAWRSSEIEGSPDFTHNPLTCPSCQSHIGTPMNYKTENRPALRMNKSNFQKKVYSPRPKAK